LDCVYVLYDKYSDTSDWRSVELEGVIADDSFTLAVALYLKIDEPENLRRNFS